VDALASQEQRTIPAKEETKEEEKGTVDGRCDHYFPTCVVHRDEDAGETMRAGKLV